MTQIFMASLLECDQYLISFGTIEHWIDFISIYNGSKYSVLRNGCSVTKLISCETTAEQLSFTADAIQHRIVFEEFSRIIVFKEKL